MKTFVRAKGRKRGTHRFPTVAKVRHSIERIAEPVGRDGEERERPIFLLANGWRTGSTLLQRILVTDRSVLLWGEPLGRMALIPRLTEALCAFGEDWPPEQYWIDESDGLSTTWIANLFPMPGDLRAGLRQWLLHWLAKPAGERGFDRWGLKEVRLSAADAVVLRWLFPEAKFVVVVRHPVDAYRSASRAAGGLRFWYRWPDRPVNTAARYAEHWNRLALSWQDLPSDFGHVVIRYEDVIAGRVDFRQLEEALQLSLEEEQALEARLGSTRNGEAVGRFERRRVLRATVGGRQAYGYE